MRILSSAAALLLALSSASAQRPAPPRWIVTWSASQFAAPPRPPADSIDRVPTYVNRTIRQIVHTSIGGDRVRIRLSNEYGDQPLVISSAHMALRGPGAAIAKASDRTITFGGSQAVTLRPGAVMVSDPVTLDVPAVGDLAVSIYVRDSIRASTRHAAAYQTNYISASGDFAASESFAPDTTIRMWLFLQGVDVTNARAPGAIVCIGNSITDGTASTPDANHRWPNVLAERLNLSSAEPARGVANAGIGGNRVLSPNTGPSALARFDRDVLMQPGVTHVILLEGINDIGRASMPREAVSAENLIVGYRQLADRAHERGLIIIGATLTPFGGARTYSPETAAMRDAVNTWIRTSGVFDGVIDFDKATRDPSDPTRFLPAYDSGDHLHPSDAGYKAMGEAIDLALFRKR